MADDRWKGIDFYGKAKRLNKSVRRRFPQRKSIGRIDGGQLRQLWISSKGRCQNCGDDSEITFDHVVPLSAGGFNIKQNLQLLCRVCNQRKGSEHPDRIGEKIAYQKSVIACQRRK